jgi:hypothetical protein
MDPLGILVTFAAFKIFVGLYFRTPVPVQPMKAIGGMAISHAATATREVIRESGIFMGISRLSMGVTGAITWIEKITAKPVVRGIMLGLGLSFITEGLGMMKEQPLFAVGAVILTLLFFDNLRLPAMLVLLGYGIALAFLQRPELLKELSHLSIRFRWPQISFGRMSWNELFSGFLILGLPQAPLTLGNAIIGTVAENNAHFPDRKVTAKAISVDYVVTAGVAMWNMGVAYLAGLLLYYGIQHRWIRI